MASGAHAKLTLIALATRPASITFEPVVAIVMLAATPRQHAGREVRRNEGRAPPFDLPDMGLLVVADNLQAKRAPPQDHMAQRHRVEANHVKEPGGEPAVELQRTPPALNATAGKQRQGSGGQ